MLSFSVLRKKLRWKYGIILLVFIIINWHFKCTHVINVLGDKQSQLKFNYLQCSKCTHMDTDASKLIIFNINKLPLLRHPTVPHLCVQQKDPDCSSLFQWIKQVPKYPKIVNVITLTSLYSNVYRAELKYKI